MRTRVPLWFVLAGCLAGFALGAGSRVAAQRPDEDRPEQDARALSEYPYLPTRYGEAYLPSVAEWQALRLTALAASTTRLTEHFNRQHLTCFATPRGLVMTLDLVPVPHWKHYQGGGKLTGPMPQVRADLEKAIEATMRFVRNFFSEVRDPDVAIRVYIHSESVGVWEQDRLTLNVERKAE